MRRSTRNLKIFTRVIILYLMLAIVWWSVLLYQKNKEAYEAKAENLLIRTTSLEGQNGSIEEKLDQLLKKYKKQENMIFGEAAIFMLTLGIGIWMMNRGFVGEIKVANQQRNFLLSITHELKSPLTGIQLALETLQKYNLDAEKKQVITDQGLKETERLGHLVNNLLLAAKVEGAYKPHITTVNLPTLAEEVISYHRTKNPNAQLEIEIPANFEIDIDEEAMKTILHNLIENAIKYNQNIPVVKVSAHSDGKSNIISVSDNGIGIPVKYRDMVLEKFYRIGSEDTRKAKGTGLGLYIVHALIKAHKGQLKVEDNVPQGTKFIIEVPKSR